MQNDLLTPPIPGGWLLSSSSDRAALDIVDGTGQHEGLGPHYSRRTPGSKTFTGVGKEVVLVHESGLAVWAVVLAMAPAKRGSGSSRGREGASSRGRLLWRNMVFRRLPTCPVVASELIETATEATRILWAWRYGVLPDVPLRTEVDVRKVSSANPGYCYKCAGWTPVKTVRGKLYLHAPQPNEMPPTSSATAAVTL